MRIYFSEQAEAKLLTTDHSLDAGYGKQLLILHALDDKEQRVEPQILGLHAERHAAIEHGVAVVHTLVVVLRDAVGGAEGDDDGVVGGCQVDVGNGSKRPRKGRCGASSGDTLAPRRHGAAQRSCGRIKEQPIHHIL